MFYVYVLQSEDDGELYIGSTNDLRRRLREHNAGSVAATHRRTPFALVYYEAYRNERDARHREKALKLRGQARYHLKARISRSLKGAS
jgi:putative endonuclease